MKKIFLVMLLGCFWGGVFGQVMFQKAYGKPWWDNNPCGYRPTTTVQQLNDSSETGGGYILYGTISINSSSDRNSCLIKTDLSGDTIWTRTMRRNSTATEVAASVIQCYDGGFVVSVESYFLSIRKLNANGDTVWTRSFSAAFSDITYNIKQTPDSGFVLLGNVGNGSYPFGSTCISDIGIVKTDKNGNMIFGKAYCMTYAGTPASPVSIELSEDGGFIVAGYIYNNAFLLKVNSLGIPVWNKTYDIGTSNEEFFNIKRIEGGYIICGETNTGGSTSIDDFLVMKTDLRGNPIWCKSYGGNDYERAYSVEQMTDKGFAIGGVTHSFNPQAYLIKTDSSGNLSWSKNYGNSGYEFINSVHSTRDGGLILAGGTTMGAGINDLYLIKTDASGNSFCHTFTPVTVTNNLTVTVDSLIPAFDFNLTQGSFPAQVQRGITVTNICSTSIVPEQGFENSLLLSPNPFTSTTTLTFSEAPKNASLKVINILGEVVFQSEIKNLKSEINLSNQPSGMYFVNVQTDKGMVSRKVIKQ